MSVDVAGYVGLMQADEQGTHARLMACRASIIAPAVSRAGGRIVKGTSDGVLVEFTSATLAQSDLLVEIGASLDDKSLLGHAASSQVLEQKYWNGLALTR